MVIHDVFVLAKDCHRWRFFPVISSRNHLRTTHDVYNNDNETFPVVTRINLGRFNYCLGHGRWFGMCIAIQSSF